MHFLADESCDFLVVRALRNAGHDVVAVVETCPEETDETILGLAVSQGRILLTEDKDFGQLVYAATRHTSGVVLIRFPSYARTTLPDMLLDTINHVGERLIGAFVVMQPGGPRIGRSP